MKLFRQSNYIIIIILTIIIFNLALAHNMYSQDAERYLEINGTAELNMNPFQMPR